MEGRSDLGWWSNRLQSIAEMGYDVAGFAEELNSHPDMASSRLEQFEEYVELAERLRMQLVRLPSHWEVARSEWMQLLDDPRRASTVESEFKRMQLSMRPWGLEADAYRRDWEKAGELSALEEAVERLDTLDISLALEATGVCNTIATSTDGVTLLDEVKHLEEKQAKRVANLREMAELLKLQGFHVGAIFDGGLGVAAERLEKISNWASIHQKISLEIDADIAPFDLELARDYEARRSEIQNENNSKGEKLVQDLSSEIVAVSESFRTRLGMLQKQVDTWVREGFVLPIDGAIPPEDLLVWEARMSEIEQAIEVHDSTWLRIEEELVIWPDYRGEAEVLRGDIEQLESLVDFVERLEQLTKSAIVEGNEMMESWSDFGFSMTLWKHRFDDNPRIALEEFKAYSPTLEEARRIVDAIERLDVSMGDSEIAIQHTASLRDAVLELASIDEARSWLELRRKRNLRHRVMLEDEWKKLISAGKAESATIIDNLNLKEFEELVSGTAMSKNSESAVSAVTGSEEVSKRLKEQLDLLIEGWSLQGWDTAGISDLAEKGVLVVGRILPQIRSQLEKHDMLRQRLEVLPVERSDQILTRIELDIRRPEKLEGLWSDLPNLAATLANLPSVESERMWKSWKPKKVHRPILVPHILEAVGDVAPPNPEVEALEAAVLELEKATSEEHEEVVESQERERSDGYSIIATEQTKKNDDEDKVNLEIGLENSVMDPVGDWSNFSREIRKLAEILGLEDDFNDSSLEEIMSFRRVLSPHVGIYPRDTRVDRLLRLALRSIPPAESGQLDIDFASPLISKLSSFANKLANWTKERLQYRGLSSSGKLLADSEVLGNALSRIPGPGIAIPLDPDSISLPTFKDSDELKSEIEKLRGVVMLPTVGNIVTASA